jgi:hypothetical protein
MELQISQIPSTGFSYHHPLTISSHGAVVLDTESVIKLNINALKDLFFSSTETGLWLPAVYLAVEVQGAHHTGTVSTILAFPERLAKKTNSFSENSREPGRDSNMVSPKYEEPNKGVQIPQYSNAGT